MFEFRQRQDFSLLQNVRTGFRIHPDSCLMGIGVLSWAKSDRGVKNFIHLLLFLVEEYVEMCIYSPISLQGLDKKTLSF